MKRTTTAALLTAAIAAAALLAASTLPGCQPGGPAVSEPAASEPASTAPASEPGEAAAPGGDDDVGVGKDLDIDIGDITYGVFANVEYFNENVRPNVDIERLSSPRFDNRTQSLTVDIRPPHPTTMPLAIILGSTRFLPGHTVRMRVHVYRQYDGADGKQITEEIHTINETMGEDRYTLQPYMESVDVYAGLETPPPSMLVFCELEAWLFRYTDLNTFDPETADFSAVPYKRYNGFNPARINLVQRESAE